MKARFVVPKAFERLTTGVCDVSNKGIRNVRDVGGGSHIVEKLNVLATEKEKFVLRLIIGLDDLISRQWHRVIILARSVLKEIVGTRTGKCHQGVVMGSH
jgi:hypothetical protein